MKFSIEWHSIVRDLWRNVSIIICVVFMAMMGTYIMNNEVYDPKYTSYASVIVNNASGTSNGSANLIQSIEIANIYAQVFVQPSMKQKAAEYLDMDSFDGEIEASVNAGTNIMELSVTATNPVTAYKELCAIIKVYPKLTKSLFSNGAVSVLKMPAISKSPSNEMTPSSLFKSAIIAFVGCVAVIVALSILKNTVKDEKTFNAKIDAKLLGVIPHEKKHFTFREILKRQKKGLLLSESAFISLRFSESFNKICAKMEYMSRTKGMKIFCITGVGENEGKSTVAANIAVALANRGKKVALVDMDVKKPALYKLFGVKYEHESELGNMLSGKVPRRSFKFRQYRKLPLLLLLNTRPHKDYQAWFRSGAIRDTLDFLREKEDFVIIDTLPAAIDSTVSGIVKLCDATIHVVRTDTVAVPVINDTLLTLQNAGANVCGCILNDAYDEFSLFYQFGTDESGYSGVGRYHGGYGRYDRYNKYSKYNKYDKYNKYSKYSKYSNYSKYSKYSAYSHSDADRGYEDNSPKFDTNKNYSYYGVDESGEIITVMPENAETNAMDGTSLRSLNNKDKSGGNK